MSEPHTTKSSPMKGLLYLLIVGAAAAAIAIFAQTQRANIDGVKVVTASPDPIPVSVERVTFEQGLELNEAFTGLAAAKRLSQLGFETGGRIVSVRADVGDRVSRGQVLARLDTRSLAARRAAADAQVREAAAALKLAEQTVQRQKRLADSGLVSSQRYDEALAQADTARARMESAQAQSDTLSVQIDLATVRAPFDGIVTQRMADEGAIAAPGQPLLELTETSAIEVRIGLPELAAAKLVEGETYDLYTAGRTVPATLRAKTGVIRSDQRTVNVVFDLTEPDAALAGAVMRLKLNQSVDEEGFWAPLSSMTEATRGLWSVYVAQEHDGTYLLERRLIEVVHAETDRAFVRGAVKNGDLFVTDGLQRLMPGLAVTPDLGQLASGT